MPGHRINSDRAGMENPDNVYGGRMRYFFQRHAGKGGLRPTGATEKEGIYHAKAIAV